MFQLWASLVSGLLAGIAGYAVVAICAGLLAAAVIYAYTTRKTGERPEGTSPSQPEEGEEILGLGELQQTTEAKPPSDPQPEPTVREGSTPLTLDTNPKASEPAKSETVTQPEPKPDTTSVDTAGGTKESPQSPTTGFETEHQPSEEVTERPFRGPEVKTEEEFEEPTFLSTLAEQVWTEYDTKRCVLEVDCGRPLSREQSQALEPVLERVLALLIKSISAERKPITVDRLLQRAEETFNQTETGHRKRVATDGGCIERSEWVTLSYDDGQLVVEHSIRNGQSPQSFYNQLPTVLNKVESISAGEVTDTLSIDVE